MNLLIKFPTRARKNLFFSTFNKFHQFSTSDNVYYLVSIDEDDTIMNNSETISFIKSYSNTYVYVGKSQNKIEAINRDIHLFEKSWDVLLLAADDTIPIIKGYDEIILEKMKLHYPDTDGVLHFNDGYWGSQLNTQCIIGKKYYDRFGYVYYPEYSYTHCDNEFMEVSKLLGRQTYFEEVIIKHEHPDLYDKIKDEVHQKNLEYDLIDKEIFQKRKSKFFNIDRNKQIKIVHLLLKPLDGPYQDKQEQSMQKWSEVKQFVSSYTQLFSYPNQTQLPIATCADPGMIRETQPSDGSAWISYGHYGAYMAHRKAILEEFNDALDALVIVEGDVVFNISPADMAFNFYKALEFSEKHEGSLVTFGNVGYGLGSDASKRDTSIKIGDYIKIDHFVSAHCYMITKKERNQIQQKLKTEKWHAWDIWLYWNYDKRVPIFRTLYPLVFEPSGFSMIDYKNKEINIQL